MALFEGTLRKEEPGGCCGPKRGPPVNVVVDGESLWLGEQGPIHVKSSVSSISTGQGFVIFKMVTMEGTGTPVRYVGPNAASCGQAMQSILSTL